MSLNDAIADIAGKLAALTGMKAAPTVPPEEAGVFPFAVVYERSGTTDTLADGMANDLATIFAEIHVSRVLLGAAITQAQSFRDPFLQKLIADPTLGGSVSTINDIRRTFGEMMWAGTPTIGYRFEIDVKVGL